MSETTTPKPVHEMTRSELNAEIEAAGGAPKGRVDHARSLVLAIRLKGPEAAKESARKALERAKREHGKRTNIEPVPETAGEAISQEDTKVAITTETREKRRVRNHKPARTAKKAPKAKKSDNNESRSIVAESFRSQYVRDTKTKTPSGAPTISCGDSVAKMLAGLDQDDLAKIAKENKVQERFAAWTEKLNPGQVRMNLGNVLRGMIKRGEETTIQGKRARL